MFVMFQNTCEVRRCYLGSCIPACLLAGHFHLTVFTLHKGLKVLANYKTFGSLAAFETLLAGTTTVIHFQLVLTFLGEAGIYSH